MLLPDKAMLTPLRTLGEQWLQGWQYASALNRGALEWMTLSCDPQQLWRRWLATTSQTVDRYMRSPAFLELMHYHLDALTKSTQIKFPGRSG